MNLKRVSPSESRRAFSGSWKAGINSASFIEELYRFIPCLPITACLPAIFGCCPWSPQGAGPFAGSWRRVGRGAGRILTDSSGNDFLSNEMESDDFGRLPFLKMAFDRIANLAAQCVHRLCFRENGVTQRAGCKSAFRRLFD